MSSSLTATVDAVTSRRQIVLDTETTGLEVDLGHRVIEIGCVELKNRRPTGNNYWQYLNPDREIDPGAQAVHGISRAMLADKPLFHEVSRALWDYLAGAELIIHNAAFDLGFLNREFRRCGIDTPLAEVCTVVDTVLMARKLHPGQKNNLDALCKRYNVDNSGRDFHGAQLDAQLLADVYLAMTGGQSRLLLDGANSGRAGAKNQRLLELLRTKAAGVPLAVIAASDAELDVHYSRLQSLVKKSGQYRWSDDLPPPATEAKLG